MSMFSGLSNDVDLSVVSGVQFGLLSPEEIRRRSVCEITTHELYQGSEPVPSGVIDTRMGITDSSKRCPTCGLKNTGCPGHSGHHEMAKPVFLVQFLDIVKKLVRCVCFRCSTLILDDKTLEASRRALMKLPREKRFDTVYKLCTRSAKRDCPACKARQPSTVTRDLILKLILEWKKDNGPSKDAVVDEELAGGGAEEEIDNTTALVPQMNAMASGATQMVLWPEDVLQILRRITDEHNEVLGFGPINRPEWMIATVLLVPPPCIRPTVHNELGQRREDDLTHKLSEIIKQSNLLKQKMANNASRKDIESSAMLLAYHTATYADNQLPSMTPAQHRNGRPIKSVTERLKSKEGRIRGNLLGKRVDFSARSVITPDPNISIDELGVPLRIAMNLTFPDMVNARSVERLQAMVDNGPDVYPGAKYVHRVADGRTVRLMRDMPSGAIKLEHGDVVDRHLVNGDPVLFNRQPSLHKMSMMCHRVHVMKYDTFRLNPVVTPCYNADYDGDEMNMHSSRSLTTATELQELAAVPLQIMSPRTSKPIITIVQDVALGVYRLSGVMNTVRQRVAFNTMSLIGGFSGDIEGKPVYSGIEVLSEAIPRGLYMSSRDLSIEDGRIVKGVLRKSAFCGDDNNLIQNVFREMGPDHARRLLDDVQRLICDWLCTSGFSVGISDLIVPTVVRAKMRDLVTVAKSEFAKTMARIHDGTFRNETIFSNKEKFENEVKQILENAGGGVKDLVNFDPKENRLINMIAAGSKGKSTNVQHMVGIVGQQAVEEDKKRVPNGFEGRTLPHFTKYDDSPEARGFIEHSFIEGLAPAEFFFHAMAGREGLIDTAVKSVTGDTAIIVIEDGRPRTDNIGTWIDDLMANNKERVEHTPADRNLEFLPLEKEVYIPTCDADGRASWGLLTAVTRHDPGERLYRVKTDSGREVTVAESLSLLVWRDGKFTPMNPKDVKVGDCMPVTASLPEPPVVIETVDMTEYFPKTEYVYGTDFNTAVRMMKEAQGDKFHIPRGWWEKTSGKDFTLPYTSKARLQRVIVRSEIENVRDGFLYPYHATRCGGRIPDKFVLDYENGFFLGLFLADGHTNEESGQVGITKNDPAVQAFATNWFQKLGFTTRLQDNSIAPGTPGRVAGKSQTVICSSQLLARFLDQFVGKGAASKFVPDVAFAAPREFVAGLLSGYITGDGSVSNSNNAIKTASASARLTQGITLLCARLGVFGKRSVRAIKANNLNVIYDLGDREWLPSHEMTIPLHWAWKLADDLKLLILHKDEPLRAMERPPYAGRYKTQNDVILDPVTSVEVLETTGHPKLYDVTVPSTLNFSLACQLGVHDTSDTGYIQRKLVKAMEDQRVHFDLTVRNVNAGVVQFAYGGDGFDAARLERQPYVPIALSLAELEERYLIDMATDGPAFEAALTPEAFRRSKATDPALYSRFYDEVLEDRRVFIKHVCKGNRLDEFVFFPVNFPRIVMYAQRRYAGDSPLPSDLDPKTIIDEIDRLADVLRINKNHDRNVMLGILLRAFLNPKDIIVTHGLNSAGFRYIVDKVRTAFVSGIAHPSELVGIIAAQSIGEPSTQMTLNSVAWDEKILLRMGGNNDAYVVKIGECIDGVLASSTSRANVQLHANNTEYLDVKHLQLEIQSVDEDGRMHWKPIEAITRHDVGDGCVKVRTFTGREVVATKSKSFLVLEDGKIVPKAGKDVRIGDGLPVAFRAPTASKQIASVPMGDGKLMALDRTAGLFVGAYLACGYATDRQTFVSSRNEDVAVHAVAFCAALALPDPVVQRTEAFVDVTVNSALLANSLFAWCGAAVKDVPAWALVAPLDFVEGLLDGYFGREGAAALGEKGRLVAAAPWPGLLLGVTELLARVGIAAYMMDASDEDPVSSMQRFLVSMGCEVVVSKQGRAEEPMRILVGMRKDGCADVLNDVFFDPVVAVQDWELDPAHPQVYDLTVADTRNFNLYGGLCMRDTFHSSGIATAGKSVQGVPRLRELLSATKNMKTPQMTIFLDKSIFLDVARCQEVANEVETTYMRDIVLESAIYYDPADSATDIDQDKNFVRSWQEFSRAIGCDEEATTSPWLMRFEFDHDRLLEKGLTMYDVYFAISTSMNEVVACTYSDDNAKKLVMRMRLTETRNRDVLYDMKVIEQQLLNQLILKGVTNIKKVVKNQTKFTDRAFEDEPLAFTSWEEITLNTDGSNLTEVLAHPLVNKVRTVTNDVQEIYRVLGVEAARGAIVNEIKRTLDELEVQERHLELLVDTMCARGNIMSIDRHGVNRSDIGPLAKCSFEESAEKLIMAGIFADLDRVNGVSANIMLGQIPNAGTGDSKILMDVDALLNPYTTAGPEVVKRGDCTDALDAMEYKFSAGGTFLTSEL
jgi:DNA-directed RNA polymerase beta' subunit